MCDEGLEFCKKLGWFNGQRAARFAMAVDHGKVVYAEKEGKPGVDVSGVEAVLARL
jgi:alkyl hydroperoxide reductase 1